MTAPFDLIAWDFDGVLNANVVDGRFIWADNLEADLGVSHDAFVDFTFKSGRIRDIVRGDLDLHQVMTTWLADQGSPVSADAFLDYWFEKDAHPDAEVIGWLQATPARHIIGTNNEARRAGYIENVMGFGDLVERVFASGRMGLGKPDPAFYQAITDWSGVPPERSLFIDDHGPNIAAADNLGWTGFHFTPESRAGLPAVLGIPG